MPFLGRLNCPAIPDLFTIPRLMPISHAFAIWMPLLATTGRDERRAAGVLPSTAAAGLIQRAMG